MDYLQTTIYAIGEAKKPVFQLSGGRDSLCAFVLLNESGCVDFDVAWVNTGDAPRETIELMASIRELVGSDKFFELKSDSLAVRAEIGTPSPLIRSEESDSIFALSSSDRQPFTPQYRCCFFTTMLPMAQFVASNGYDLVIRGNRASDAIKTPLDHLSSENGITYCYPIYDWRTDRVNHFLDAKGILPSFYEFMNDGVDCISCPAMWGNGHQAWLEKHYPEAAIRRAEEIKHVMTYIGNVIQLGFNELDSKGYTNGE